MSPLFSLGHSITRYLLIVLGWFCIALAVLGIFLPLLPTTVFVLTAAWCFARSSERFNQWLLNHRTLGPIIHNWRSNNGIDRDIRNRTILLLWLSMLISILIIGKLWAVLLLLSIGASVSIYLLRLPLVNNQPCPVAQNSQPSSHH